MKVSFFVFLVCAITSLHSIAQSLQYGLHIQTFPSQLSEYTSMLLENGNLIETKGKEINISFDLLNRQENVFGAIFRIITDDNKNIDLMYGVSENDERFPYLVTGDKTYTIAQQLRRDSWIPVDLTFNPKNGNIDISYDNTQIAVNYPALIGTQGIRVVFGYCSITDFIMIDVASFDLKNISISRGHEKIRLWKMEEHAGDICYDEIVHSPALGQNPVWIVDQYLTWEKVYEQNFKTYPSIAFDPIIGTFYIAKDNKELYAFHATENITDTIQVKGGEFVANYPNQMIYIPPYQLLSYNLDENIFSSFDFWAQKWEGKQSPVLEHDYWNNTVVYNPIDSSLISFGGYGHYHYNNKLLISYPYRNESQQYTNLEEIAPRYGSSSAIVDSVLYIFGGRGNISGKQELSPHHFYDLYAINLFTKQCKQLWNIEEPLGDGDFYPGSNMVYDEENDCFYFFSTQNGGTLIKMDVESPNFEVMSFPIGLPMDSHFLYTNLYYSSIQKKLYAVIVGSGATSEKSSLEIYALNYPPIPISSSTQANVIPVNSKVLSQNWMVIAEGLIVVCLIIIGAFYYKKTKKGKVLQKNNEPITTLKEEEIKEIHVQPSVKTTSFHYYDFSKSCIRFFGGFHVMDKEGNDLTPLFTPILKSLLVIFIIYTEKEKQGISGNKLIQLLWSDKIEDSAKNNRNVYISKLRNMLDKVGDIKIVNQNRYWRIELGNDTFCDYIEAIRLYKKNNNQDLEKLLELLLNGMMLPDLETEWIDTFKNEFSNQTIDILCRLLKKESLSNTLKLKIADTLFQHDYINEEALSIKCRILCKERKKGLAKTVYDTFCKDYLSSMGVKYKYSLADIIRNTPEFE